jgi:hypothetical protein
MGCPSDVRTRVKLRKVQVKLQTEHVFPSCVEALGGVWKDLSNALLHASVLTLLCTSVESRSPTPSQSPGRERSFVHNQEDREFVKHCKNIERSLLQSQRHSMSLLTQKHCSKTCISLSLWSVNTSTHSSLSLSSLSLWQVTRVSPYVRARSLTLQGDPANIGKRRSRPARCTREAVDRFGIPNPRKSGLVIGADRQRFGPSCVFAETRATRPNGEWGYSTRRQCWATSTQRRCRPEEALYLPTFSYLFDCQ